MSEIQHTQTVQAEMEYLLTSTSFMKWLISNLYTIEENFNENEELTVTQIYLKEHGLPLDSEIKGL